VKALLAALAALGGLLWWRNRRQHALPEPQPDPADELRAKLAEARRAPDDRDAFESGEQPVDQIDVRRADVHERARGAIDEFRVE
jgi:hypothetical protein